MAFISTAFAAEGAQPGTTMGGQDPFSLILMVVIFIAVFYFLMWRPQSKRNKEHRQLISGVQPGDEVVTAGGITGKVSKIQENMVLVTIAKDVDIMVQKTSIASMLPKGTLKHL